MVMRRVQCISEVPRDASLRRFGAHGGVGSRTRLACLTEPWLRRSRRHSSTPNFRDPLGPDSLSSLSRERQHLSIVLMLNSGVGAERSIAGFKRCRGTHVPEISVLSVSLGLKSGKGCTGPSGN